MATYGDAKLLRALCSHLMSKGRTQAAEELLCAAEEMGVLSHRTLNEIARSVGLSLRWDTSVGDVGQPSSSGF